ncbi:hypothetical protein [Nocardioides rubriscoriae]|uniref:hypothetical protein n=1 Tax=Nocardioides rubriscoriae TaxID=642762 RepID=UPI0011E001E7|nr:hypothetical protein [Nocardioides rubriscoriae]
MSQTPRRPVRPARTPTSRPRKIAGQQRPEPVAPVVVPDVAPGEPAEAPAGPVEPTEPTEPTEPDVASYDEQPAGRGPLVGLVVAIVLLLGLGVAEVVYLRSDPEPSRTPLSAERPVQVADLEVRRVVDQAATAADLILSASSKDYDGQVAKATATMTDPFAAKYRQTKADIKDEFVAAQTEVVVDISAQGVVSASDQEIKALLFLTQTTQKGTRGGVKPVQYRVTVTMVDTADGWLVSDLVAL